MGNVSTLRGVSLGLFRGIFSNFAYLTDRIAARSPSREDCFTLQFLCFLRPTKFWSPSSLVSLSLGFSFSTNS